MLYFSSQFVEYASIMHNNNLSSSLLKEKYVYAQLIFASKTIDTSHPMSGANNFFYSNITNTKNNKKAAVYLVLDLAAADLNAPKDSISYLRASEYNFEDSKPSVMLPETKLFL